MNSLAEQQAVLDAIHFFFPGTVETDFYPALTGAGQDKSPQIEGATASPRCAGEAGSPTPSGPRPVPVSAQEELF